MYYDDRRGQMWDAHSLMAVLLAVAPFIRIQLHVPSPPYRTLPWYRYRHLYITGKSYASLNTLAQEYRRFWTRRQTGLLAKSFHTGYNILPVLNKFYETYPCVEPTRWHSNGQSYKPWDDYRYSGLDGTQNGCHTKKGEINNISNKRIAQRSKGW